MALLPSPGGREGDGRGAGGEGLRLAFFAVLFFAAALPCPAAEFGFDVAVEHVSATFTEQRTFDARSVTLGLDLASHDSLLLRLEVPAIRARASQPLYMLLGPTPRVLNALAHGNRNLRRQVPGSWESGLGDVRLRVLRELGGGGARLFRVAAEVDVKAPTGDARQGLGSGEWDARLGLLAERRFWSATLFGGAGWNRLGDPDGPEMPELRDVPDGLLGVESEPWHGLTGALWVEGHGEVLAGSGRRSAVGLGLRSSGRTPWRFSATYGLSGAREELGFLLGVSLAGLADENWGRLPRRDRRE